MSSHSAPHDDHSHHGDHGHGHSAGHAHHGEHHTPAHYKKIWALLCVLLVVSVLGPELEIQVVTLVTAFGIAGVKAYMVIKHFMHLDEEPPVIWYILITGIAFMFMMFAALSVDIMNHDGARWTNVAAKTEIQRGMAYGDPADHHADHGAEPGAGHTTPPAADHGAAPAGAH